MNPELERDMWKQRTKNIIQLLIEAQDRLDGTLPGHSADNVARWLNEVTATGWIAEAKSMPNIPYSRLDEIDEAIAIIKKDWRKLYAERFGTIPENIFYWWELTRKLKAAARKDFSDLFIFDCVYYVSEKQIMSRGIKAHQDNAEEIPF